MCDILCAVIYSMTSLITRPNLVTYIQVVSVTCEGRDAELCYHVFRGRD